MSDTTGRTVPLSLGRRVVGDFVFAAMKLPLVTFQKDMNVSALVAAREYAQPRPSWCAIFTKAYAKVVAATPALRRVALTFPWERMFEYDETTADVVAEVPAADEKQVVNIPLRQPENCPLPAIDDIVASYRKEPMLLRRSAACHERSPLAAGAAPLGVVVCAQRFRAQAGQVFQHFRRDQRRQVGRGIGAADRSLDHHASLRHSRCRRQSIDASDV